MTCPRSGDPAFVLTYQEAEDILPGILKNARTLDRFLLCDGVILVQRGATLYEQDRATRVWHEAIWARYRPIEEA